MRCDSPNWGENADWCVIHEQEPLLCVSIHREALETQNRILRKAAAAGAKSIKLWLKEGCGCDAEGHVCGIRAVREALSVIEEAIAMPDPPTGELPGRHGHEKVTVREACRRRMPLDGTDAQALEHGLTQLEHEKKEVQEQYDALAFRVQMMNLQHPVGCADAALRFRYEMEAVQAKITDQEIRFEAVRKWCCSACGLYVKNDPKFNQAFPEKPEAQPHHCKRCGVQIHPSGAFCTPCSGALKKL